jgi:hypothetical protein
LVVLAVSSNPLSVPHFPANREFYREILRFLALVHAWRWIACCTIHCAKPTMADHLGSKRTGNFLEITGN